jgi:hypothetical protein
MASETPRTDEAFTLRNVGPTLIVSISQTYEIMVELERELAAVKAERADDRIEIARLQVALSHAKEGAIYIAPLLGVGKPRNIQVRFVSRHAIFDRPTEANPSPVRIICAADLEASMPLGTARGAIDAARQSNVPPDMENGA